MNIRLITNDSTTPEKYDAISVTANPDGFTHLNGIVSGFEKAKEGAAQANETGNCVIVNDNIIIVPQTKGNSSEAIIKDVFDKCNFLAAKTLNFAHYGFLPRNLQETEIRAILGYLKNNKDRLSVKEIYWNIDKRKLDEMQNILNEYKDILN